MNQKLISFCVPCYNSEKDMRKCLDSLITQKDRVEIIIIDDGSKDSTPQIADEYASKYPDAVIAVHQENGGHGAGINKALSLATGKYFKVVDSDDWVDQEGYKLLLSKIEKFGDKVDMYVTDYAYYKVNKVQKIIKYNHVLKVNEISSWDSVKHFALWENLTLHSTMYRREVLLEAKIDLPHHVFYEDNYFIYSALPFVKSIYYLPTTFYMYFIGREGQSVSREQCIKRFHDHYYIAHLMNHIFNVFDYKQNKGLYNTLMHHLILVNSIAYVYTRLTNTPESIKTYRELKKETKALNKKLYRKLKYRSFAGFVMADGILGRALMKFSLWISHKVVPFN